jgi:predicted phosphodiesterase
MRMRVGVISDIHGNCLALDAALADLERQGVDTIICLGDAIQGGPQPAETVARLRDIDCPVVMGNADAWLLSGQETGNEPLTSEARERLATVREWSLAQLSADDRAFMARFAPTLEVRLDDDRQLLTFHGSPTSFDEIILPLTPHDDLWRVFGPYADHFLCGGHTHVQHIRHVDRRSYFNPGSIGFAYRHGQDEAHLRADPWAEYAVLTVKGERVDLSFHRVPYDAAALIDIYRLSGRPFAEEAAAQYE